MMLTRISMVAVVTAAFFAPLLTGAAEVPTSAGIQAQLQAMNASDCIYAKRADTKSWLATLAPEYVSIEANGARTTYKDLTAGENDQSTNKVTSCSTRVSSVTRDGARYYLYGDYSEEGVLLKTHQRYRTLERIRDTWRRIGGRWKQTQSLAYEYTAWIDGKLVEHRVLSKAARQSAIGKLSASS